MPNPSQSLSTGRQALTGRALASGVLALAVCAAPIAASAAVAHTTEPTIAGSPIFDGTPTATATPTDADTVSPSATATPTPTESTATESAEAPRTYGAQDRSVTTSGSGAEAPVPDSSTAPAATAASGPDSATSAPTVGPTAASTPGTTPGGEPDATPTPGATTDPSAEPTAPTTEPMPTPTEDADDDGEYATPVARNVASDESSAFEGEVHGIDVLTDGDENVKVGLVGDPVGGTFTVEDDETVSFSAADGFSGTASVQFVITNSEGEQSNAATLTVEVAEPRVVLHDDSAEIPAGETSVVIEMLANDEFDPEEQRHRVRLDGASEHGSLDTPAGTFVFEWNEAAGSYQLRFHANTETFAGSASATYIVTAADGQEYSATITVTGPDFTSVPPETEEPPTTEGPGEPEPSPAPTPSPTEPPSEGAPSTEPPSSGLPTDDEEQPITEEPGSLNGDDSDIGDTDLGAVPTDSPTDVATEEATSDPSNGIDSQAGDESSDFFLPGTGLEEDGVPSAENYADPVPQAPGDVFGSDDDVITATGADPTATGASGEDEPTSGDGSAGDDAFLETGNGEDVSTSTRPLDGPGMSWAIPTLIGIGVAALGVVGWVTLRRRP